MFRYALLIAVIVIGVVVFANWVGGAIEQGFAKQTDRIENPR